MALTSELARLSRHTRRLVGDLAQIARVLDGRSTLRYGAQIARHAPRILAARSLKPADTAMAGSAYDFHLLGTSIRLDGEDFAGAREMYGRGVYFANRHVQLRPDDVVVDLGANRGLFTVLAARTAARVVAVEAQGGLVPRIERLLDVNGCRSRAQIVHALIGSGSGVFADNGALHAAADFATEPERLTMTELLSKTKVDRIGFLKMDIEGSEFDLLARDREWLDRVDRIAMEVHPRFGDATALKATMEAHGFSVAMLDADLAPAERLHQDAGYLFAWRQRK